MKLFDMRENELVSAIKEASQAYYESGTSKYSDEKFDKMLHELRAINPNHPLLAEVGHGYNVESAKGIKVKHKYGKAGSLGKAYSVEEIPDSILYAEKIQLSLKLDGLSIVLYYKNGTLDKALTRGNGDIGIDKTDRISLIVPSKLLATQFSGAIRGELIFNERGWKKFLEKHPDAKNPRNSAAGLINADDFDPEEFKLLDFVAYTVVGTDWDVPMPTIFSTLEEVEDFLRCYMPHVVPHASFLKSTSDGAIRVLPDILKLTMDDWCTASGYKADGIVLKNNKINLIEHSNYIEYEYDAIAFKFESEIKETTVVDVEWNLSKNNCLIPTVIVEPVELAGTTVRRATGYNAAYIMDNHVAKGAVVKITKCGEIIPNIVEIVKPAPETPLPFHCPICGDILIWDKNDVHLKCVNEYCGNTRMQDIIIWCKNIAPIEGFKDALIARFVTEYYGEYATVETIMTNTVPFTASVGTQQSMFTEMINKLHSSDDIPIKDALMALNIPRLGEITCSKMANNYLLCKSLIFDIATFDKVFEETVSGIEAIVGEATTKSIEDNADKLFRLKYIADRIVFPVISEVKGEVVITGKLSISRNDFEKELNSKGYKLSNTVNKNTICLITDDPNSSSSKNKKASELGIPKLSESEFRNKYM